MTALPAEKRYTYADLLSWEEDVRYELYDGYPIALIRLPEATRGSALSWGGSLEII